MKLVKTPTVSNVKLKKPGKSLSYIVGNRYYHLSTYNIIYSCYQLIS